MRLIETWLADPERAFDLFAKFPAEEKIGRAHV